jgi:hypothetical protein
LAIYDSLLFYVQGDIFGHSSSFSTAVSSPSARLSSSTPTAGAGAGSGAGASFSGKSRLHTVDDADFNLIDDEDSVSQSYTVGNSVASSSSSASSSAHVYNQSPAIEFLMKAIDPSLVQAMGGVSRSTKFE